MLATAIFFVTVFAADAAPVRTVTLSDMAPSAALKGAVLRIERKSGAFNEGLVTSADDTHLVIDSMQDVPADDIVHIVTLRPARQPVAPGAFVRVVVRSEGNVFRGVVTDVGDESIAVQDATSEARVRWTAIDRIDVEMERRDGVALLRELARPEPTPPLPPLPVMTPYPEPVKPRFPDAGTMEVGGGFSFSSGSSELTSSASESQATGHSLSVRPFAGYFLVRGLEVLGEGTFASTVTNYKGSGDDWNNDAGVRLGAAYFFVRPSGVCFGPQFLFGFYSSGGEFVQGGITYEFEERGSSGTAGLGIRVPVGEGALVTIGAGFYRERYTVEIYPGQLVSDYRGSRDGFETTLGFSMWLQP